MKAVLGCDARLVWHKDAELPSGTQAVLIPGGFSYGDYLRAGAMAAASPVMAAVKRFAEAGGPVLGVCNGFQILCESGLLPGVLIRNHHLHFVCDFVHVRVEQARAPFTSRVREGAVLRLPIKHGEGAYFADAPTLDALEERGQVLLRYCDAQGNVGPESNPNGALREIAGLSNPRGNVFGMMPRARHHARRVPAHPEDPGARAQLHRARNLLRDVVGALQLQELPGAPEDVADAGAVHPPGTRRERRRRGHRRRPRHRVQDGEPQSPLVHRAAPGRGHGRGGHHPGHLHDGGAADRAPGPSPLRSADRREEPLRGRGGRGRNFRVRKCGGGPDSRRRAVHARDLRREPPGERLLPRPRAQGSHLSGAGQRRRKPGPLRRRQDRP
jgi:phosphoribosylformylglycinamidine synthase subunit PurQ / glutaminase